MSTLAEKFSSLNKKLRGQARLTESNIQDTLREIRMALLEADVALPVVRDFITRVKEKALGQEVLGSLTPGQAFIGIVHTELGTTIGQGTEDIDLSHRPPVVILIAGLQGTGKTTTTGKLARYIRQKHKKKVLTVSADVYRPAAIEQLKTVSQQAEVEYFPTHKDQKPEDIACTVLDYAKKHYIDVLLVDTAGRLSVDEAMMTEVKNLHNILQPAETLFVLDAMQGQDAINTAKRFDETLALTGIVMTKLDGDARGGAALSVRHITGKPIKFAGISEKLDGLELFDGQRHAGRILGMGDVVALVEQVKANFDEVATKKLTSKLKKGKSITLNDFLMQIQQLKKMGGVSSLLEKLPAELSSKAGQLDSDKTERDIRRKEAIIYSMTKQERSTPLIIKASRKRRIASGAGVQVQDVNRLLKEFDQMRTMMKKMQGGGLMKMMQRLGGNQSGFPGMFR
jgi:signal recognition particle subunit SRP54